MIDKLTPRSLQTDKAIRSVGPTEMLDALNITVTGNEDGGDGVLKNIKGNQSVPAIHNNGSPLINMPLGENIVIGSTEDETLGVVYFYVFNSLGSHGVYAYSESTKTYRLIFSDPSLNFSRNGFVKGDVVRVARREEDVAIEPLTPDPEPVITGCTDPSAVNYNESASVDDGSCAYNILGCTQPNACNYVHTANADDGSCIFPDPGFDCEGNTTTGGCTDPAAFNFDPAATEDDGSCVPVIPGCMNLNAANYDPEANVNDGSCIYIVPGCTNSNACNYDSNANTDNGSCIFPEEGLDCNGNVLEPIDGCMDPNACNYNPEATFTTLETCTYPESEQLDCGGNPLEGDLVLIGCTDPTACNYVPTATQSDNSCTYDCYGCTDPTAANYDASAQFDDGTCIVGIPGCTIPTACNYNPEANVLDDSCEFNSCSGCMDENACNYDPTATITTPNACVYADPGYDCDGVGTIPGCTDTGALNWNPTATIDDGSCEFPLVGCTNPNSCDFNHLATFDDGEQCVNFPEPGFNCDGEFIGVTVFGCTDAAACNYDNDATDDDGSCTYPPIGQPCGGGGIGVPPPTPPIPPAPVPERPQLSVNTTSKGVVRASTGASTSTPNKYSPSTTTKKDTAKASTKIKK